METGENLCGPVERIDIAAMAFDVDPDLAVGALLGGFNGRYDLLLLVPVEQGFAFEERDRQCLGI